MDILYAYTKMYPILIIVLALIFYFHSFDFTFICKRALGCSQVFICSFSLNILPPLVSCIFFAFFPYFFFLPIPEHLNFFPIVPVNLYHTLHQIVGKRKLEGNKYFWMRRRFLYTTAGLRITRNNPCVRKN